MEGYHDILSYPDAEHLPGLVIHRFDGPVFSANATTFPDEIRRLAVCKPPPTWILIATGPVTDVDTTATDVLTELDETLNSRGIYLVFAELKDPVQQKIGRYGLTGTIDPHHFPTIGGPSQHSATKPELNGPPPISPPTARRPQSGQPPMAGRHPTFPQPHPSAR